MTDLVSASTAAQSPAEAEAYVTARQFLFHEAELIDGGRFLDWLELLTPDIVYQAPVRVTRERGPLPQISDEMFHFDENATTLRWRVERLRTEFAWAEDPPSRTRHFVSNIRVRSTTAQEIVLASSLLVYRNRGSDPGHDLLSAEREDVLRREHSRWRLARRRVLLDQATLGTKNLAIFL